MTSAKVFIVLLNWNNWQETEECLESLGKVDYQNFEIIVVDNGSTTSICPLRKGTGGGVIPIFNVANLGFAGGNNVGIQYALEHGADYIMLLNNDTVVASDFLTELVNAASHDSRYGILGSRILKYGTDKVIFDGGKVNKWLHRAEHIAGRRGNGGVSEVEYITGAAMLIRRKVIEKIGFMREEYFLYYEDVDWCIRARRAGYACVLVPQSKVWHKVSATTKEGSPSYIYYHTRNALMLAKFNGNIIQKIAAYVMGLWILWKQGGKFFLLPKKRVWTKSLTRGVLDFYRGTYGQYDSK